MIARRKLYRMMVRFEAIDAGWNAASLVRFVAIDAGWNAASLSCE